LRFLILIQSLDLSSIGTISPLTHHALEAHIARGPKQVWSDLALLEVSNENAVRAAAQQLRQVGLAHGQRQAAQILAVERQDVEGVKLDFFVALAGCRALKSAMPSTPRMTATLGTDMRASGYAA
jgi:hypothetical protein